MIRHNTTMNKRYSYTPIIIAVILLLSYSQGHYLFATQNSPVEEQTKNASNDENKQDAESRTYRDKRWRRI